MPGMTELPTLLLPGGGMVGHRAVEAAVERGLHRTHRIVLVGEERQRPYDRVHLSSCFDGGSADALALVDADWCAANDVELVVGDPVADLDTGARTATTASGRAIACEVQHDDRPEDPDREPEVLGQHRPLEVALGDRRPLARPEVDVVGVPVLDPSTGRRRLRVGHDGDVGGSRLEERHGLHGTATACRGRCRRVKAEGPFANGGGDPRCATRNTFVTLGGPMGPRGERRHLRGWTSRDQARERDQGVQGRRRRAS